MNINSFLKVKLLGSSYKSVGIQILVPGVCIILCDDTMVYDVTNLEI